MHRQRVITRVHACVYTKFKLTLYAVHGVSKLVNYQTSKECLPADWREIQETLLQPL